MLKRIDAAIVKLDAKVASIPVDERVDENKDYYNIANVIISLRAFRVKLEKMEQMLDKLGV